MSYAAGLRSASRSKAETSPQVALPGRESDMEMNRAGGFVFTIDRWARLHRFLILGADSSTYYASARELTLENATVIVELLEEDGLRVVAEATDVSLAGEAPNNDPALFVLAMASSFGAAARTKRQDGTLTGRLVGNAAPSATSVRKAALAALPQVARTATHLMTFCGYVGAFRGWGTSLRSAVGNWFDGMDAERLSLQAVKYRSRRDGEGETWTLRDLLRLAHRTPSGDERDVLVDWIVHRERSDEAVAAHNAHVGAWQDRLPPVYGRTTPRRHHARPLAEVLSDARARFRLVDGYHRAQEATTAAEAAAAIRSHSVPFECIRSEHLAAPEVWDALLEDMPMTAMLRNLGRMAAIGLLSPLSEASRHVAEQLSNIERLRAARVHPYSVLLALKTFGMGRGHKGSLRWTPVPLVMDALDAAFYSAFQNVQPTGARKFLGIDVSSSMDFPVLGAKGAQSPISAREAAAAMAMVSAGTEREVLAYGFTSGSRGLTALDLSGRRRLDDVCRAMMRLPMGGTDATLVIRHAISNRLAVDVFEVYTDNESYAGPGQVSEWLNRYRDQSGIPAKLVSVAFSTTSYSVADPLDPGQMDVVGFDASAPAVMAEFVRRPIPRYEAEPEERPRMGF